MQQRRVVFVWCVWFVVVGSGCWMERPEYEPVEVEFDRDDVIEHFEALRLEEHVYRIGDGTYMLTVTVEFDENDPSDDPVDEPDVWPNPVSILVTGTFDAVLEIRDEDSLILFEDEPFVATYEAFGTYAIHFVDITAASHGSYEWLISDGHGRLNYEMLLFEDVVRKDSYHTW